MTARMSRNHRGIRALGPVHRTPGNSTRAQKAKTIRSVADYLYSNRERMRYDHYLANGWPIASGTVEGACKNLIRDRFERSGMRWTIETAEALLPLRAAHLSGDYNNYWEHHIAADQARLHRKHDWEVVLK